MHRSGLILLLAWGWLMLPAAAQASEPAAWSIYPLAGYQHMGLEFQCPAAPGPFGLILRSPAPLDLDLKGGHMVTGGLGLSVHRDRLSGFLEAGRSAGRSARVSTPTEPFWMGMQPVEWNAAHMTWSSLDAGIGVDVSPAVTLLAGVKREELSMDLENPTDPVGMLPRLHEIFGDSYRGHVQNRLTMPWVGARLHGSRWGARIRVSPFARAEFEAPLTYVFPMSPTLPARTEDHETYSFSNTGLWAEVDTEITLVQARRWRCAGWAKAAWLRVTGKADVVYRTDFIGVPAPPFSMSGQSTAYSTLIQRTVGTGLTISCSF